MTSRLPLRRIGLMLVSGLALFALLYLAASLPAADFRGGIPPEIGGSGGGRLPMPDGRLLPPIVFDIARILLWVSLLLSLLYLLSTPELRSELVGLITTNSISLVALLLLAGVIISLVLSTNTQYDIPDEAESFESLYEPDEVADYLETLVESPEPPPTLTWLLSLLFLVGVLGLAYVIWRSRPRPAERPLSYQELSERAFAAIAELRQGQQLDDVILRCYQEMSETVARQQRLRRQDGATPREFARTLQRAGLPETAVIQLTALFEQVRYGGLMPGKREQLQAIDSLEAIVAACDRMGQERAAP